ncbi:glucodextranase DOMON-like domain-containing protein [Halomarina halobia]|uniref:Glucodextranase DOMON-like domain-containing protein n=1 Tax=Halomarina halobia TaxID=3033386 RepID=A0ABD6AAA1_9EURY|nr:glucodextranase DOMON-like domain-containing protein [Halomarina sp. PSR21]
MTRLSRREALRLVGAGALGASALPAAAQAREGPSGGADATWTTGEQYGIGTVADHGSDEPNRVWFTLTEGSLASVRFPRIDLMNTRTLDFVVADGSGYAKRTHDVERIDGGRETLSRRTEPSDDDALLFRQTIEETGDGREWTLAVEYAIDPDREAVLADVSFEAGDGREYDVYAVADLALSSTGMADAASVRGDDSGSGRGVAAGYALTARDTGANDDEAVFLDPDGNPYNVATALVARRGFGWATVDVVGGDAVSPLLTAGDASTTYDGAEGNVVLAGRLASGARRVHETVALGFAEGADEDAAREEARGALRRDFAAARARYARTWRDYLGGLAVPESVRGDPDLRRQYDVAAMALKAADSKLFPGAGVASLSVPWGEAVNANEPQDYGYNFTWSRDLYQAFTALAAMGDVDSAREAVEYLYAYQQGEDGFLPQNTYVDGRTRWGGEQMDNVSFPQVMAYQLRERFGVGFEEADYGYENVRRSADYVVANGPATGQERWEEESGYSPSTIAAEVAGLAAAASLAADEGERADALAYLALADHWRANVEEWTVTETGSKSKQPYYVRVNDDRDPDDGAPLDINNGGPTLDERECVDAGFLELVRLGVKPWDDPTIRTSLGVVDDTIRVDTPNGPAWYRYNGDGYGEQDGSDYPEGAPWSLDNSGRGRLWPIFTGERGEYELLAGGTGDLAPASLLRTMANFANSGLMLPEQVWDREDPTEYGWAFGEGTGSATPLSWSMAQFVRLAHSIDAGEPVETPRFVSERYGAGDPPEGPALDVEFPPSVVGDRTATVSGATDGAEVVVKAGGETVSREVTDGAFEVDVAVGDGETAITVVAATGEADATAAGTAVARSSVARVDVGEAVREWADPAGDDHGPGSYVYPTAGEFVDGAFDLTSFGVYETADAYQFLVGLGTLTNPWGGNELSLQSIQLYLRDPNASGGTTAAREGVNASFEAAYQRRVFVEGFVPPVVEAADGSVVSRDVRVTGYRSVDAVEIEVPKSALGGSLDGTELVPLLLGQDGYSPGRVRPVEAEAGDYAFGGGVDGDANPNVVDLVTPEGASQAEALSYSGEEEPVIPFLSL